MLSRVVVLTGKDESLRNFSKHWNYELNDPVVIPFEKYLQLLHDRVKKLRTWCLMVFKAKQICIRISMLLYVPYQTYHFS